jgi:DNA repair protein RadC
MHVSQYKEDEKRFVELFSKFTGIKEIKLEDFLKDNTVNLIIEHTDLLDITQKQREKVKELRELKNIYSTLKSDVNVYTVDSPTKAGSYYQSFFEDVKEKEYFACSFLNTKSQIITTQILSTGSVNESPVYPREIVKAALLHDAHTVILAHNHPSGNPEPSPQDIEITKHIHQALNTVRINLVDHIISGSNGYVSFAERGLVLGNNLSQSKLGNVAGTREGSVSEMDEPGIGYTVYHFAKLRNEKALEQIISKTGYLKDQYMSEALALCTEENDFGAAGFLLRNGADFNSFKSLWDCWKQVDKEAGSKDDFVNRLEKYNNEVITKNKPHNGLQLNKGR